MRNEDKRSKYAFAEGMLMTFFLPEIDHGKRSTSDVWHTARSKIQASGAKVSLNWRAAAKDYRRRSVTADDSQSGS